MAIGQLVIIAVLAYLLSTIGWRTSYAVVGAVNFVIVVPVVLLFARSRPDTRAVEHETSEDELKATAQISNVDKPVTPAQSVSDLIRSKHMWLLMGMFGMCGFMDFFVTTHIVAFAIDQGVGKLLAGNMLALMGLMALAGVMLSGYLSDRYGPAMPTIICFIVRLGLFVFILNSQNTPSIIVFAMLYGSTFLMTAPLGPIFAGQLFGARFLGTVTGIVSMVHQIFGGLGAFVGAFFFDTFGKYDGAFALVLGMSIAAIVVSVPLHVLYTRNRQPSSI
jgi:sugar phosphate permease